MRIGVVELALACCAIESSTALRMGLPRQSATAEIEVAQPGEVYDLHLLVVAGTVTVAGASDVLAAWDSLPEPKAALAFGVCAASGEPYWDSPLVVPGVEQLLPVVRFVPGCPPPPAALMAAIEEVAGAYATS